MKPDKIKIAAYLNDHIGDEMSTYQLMEDCFGEEFCSHIDQAEWFDVEKELTDVAKKEGIVLDKSKYANKLIGLSYVIEFVIKGK